MTSDQIKSLISRLANDAPISVDGVELTKKAKKKIAKIIGEYFGNYLTASYVDEEDVIHDAAQHAGGLDSLLYGKDKSEEYISKRKEEEKHPLLKRAAFVAGAYYLYKKIFSKDK